jgi:hypothetical protein
MRRANEPAFHFAPLLRPSHAAPLCVAPVEKHFSALS